MKQFRTTALLEAAAGGHLRVLTKLAELGVDPTVVDRVSDTACAY